MCIDTEGHPAIDIHIAAASWKDVSADLAISQTCSVAVRDPLRLRTIVARRITDVAIDEARESGHLALYPGEGESKFTTVSEDDYWTVRSMAGLGTIGTWKGTRVIALVAATVLALVYVGLRLRRRLRASR